MPGRFLCIQALIDEKRRLNEKLKFFDDLFLSDTFPKIQSLCFREHPACKPLYKYGWEPLTDDAPGSVHADYARYSRRLCRIRTASSAFFVNEKKRMGILFSRYAGGCRKRYNDTKIKRHPKNAKREHAFICPYYTINFRKWKVLKAQFTIRLHLGGYNSLYPLCHEALVPLLPVCAFDPFSWFQNSILSQMKTYSCTFFREIWLLHRSYSTKISHNPVFPLPVERKCALPLKYISRTKTPLKLKIMALWNVSACSLLLLSLLLSLSLFFLTVFSVFLLLVIVFFLFTLSFLYHDILHPYLKSWEHPWWTASVSDILPHLKRLENPCWICWITEHSRLSS